MPSCPWRVGAALLGDKRVVYVDGGCWLGLKLSQDWEGGKLLASFLFYRLHITYTHSSWIDARHRRSAIAHRHPRIPNAIARHPAVQRRKVAVRYVLVDGGGALWLSKGGSPSKSRKC